MKDGKPYKVVIKIHLTDAKPSSILNIADAKASVKCKLKKDGEKMKIDKNKLAVAIANECISFKDLCKKAGISEVGFRQIRAGTRNPKPITVGKIARALNVNVQEIIAEE